MDKFKVKITEMYCYEIEVEAKDRRKALEKAKYIYEEDYEEYGFVADATTLESTKYKVQ